MLWRKARSVCHGQAGHLSSPQLRRPPDHLGSFSKFLLTEGPPLSRLPRPGTPTSRPWAALPPRLVELRSGRAAVRRTSREQPRRPHPRRLPGGLARARHCLPLLLPRRQEPPGPPLCIIHSDGQGAFWRAHAGDARSSAGDYLFSDLSFLETGGCCGGGGTHFFFPAEGGGFFARSSQERAAPRAQEGACQSRRVRWAAPLAARVAGRLGRDALEAWRARQDRALFLDTTPSLPTRSSRGSRSAGPGNPPRPVPPTELLLPSPLLLHLAPAPTFRSTPTQTHTHTRTLKTSPPSTSAPLPRVV